MGKGKLASSIRSTLKFVVVVIVVIAIARLLPPKNFNEMKKEAYSDFKEFTKENFNNPADYQGPYLDVSNKDYTVFRWYKLSPDTSVIGVYVSPSIWKSNFVSGQDSNWESPSL